jgi:23S rRNA (cytosine1962-C5)-methyltransferase
LVFTVTEALIQAKSMTTLSQSTAQVTLKARKAGPFWGRHPWVLDSAIAKIEGEPRDGDVVDLRAEDGAWIARGVFNSRSRIRVRLYTWEAEQSLDDSLWRERIAKAIDLRNCLGLNERNGAARLVYSEADGLSGLIVDRYGQHLVVQPTALAMAVRLETITGILVELLKPETISVRADSGVTKAEGLALDDGLLYGTLSDEVMFIEEHGVRYGVSLAAGQKTGFYLDQRDNRRVAAGYLAGRRVLDLCCYTGGFGLAAAVLGKVPELIGVDASSKAVAMATANAELNGVKVAHFEIGDCFATLDRMASQGEKFGAVVLDPPKFVKRRAGVEEALRAYHRLNRVAVELLEPGGILVTCSCSGNVSREDFFGMLFGVSLKAKRNIQVLEQRGAAADHPVSVTCPENEYLKCFICRVE